MYYLSEAAPVESPRAGWRIQVHPTLVSLHVWRHSVLGKRAKHRPQIICL